MKRTLAAVSNVNYWDNRRGHFRCDTMKTSSSSQPQNQAATLPLSHAPHGNAYNTSTESRSTRQRDKIVFKKANCKNFACARNLAQPRSHAKCYLVWDQQQLCTLCNEAFFDQTDVSHALWQGYLWWKTWKVTNGGFVLHSEAIDQSDKLYYVTWSTTRRKGWNNNGN